MDTVTMGTATIQECNTDYANASGYSTICSYVENEILCQETDGFINYKFITYCSFGSTGFASIWIAWLIFLFFSLAAICDDFLCQNLGIICKHLSLPENVAGVTLLAFGNGAADIFSAVAAITSSSTGQPNPGLAIGAIFGAGVFVTSAVVAIIGFLQPFTIMNRPFLRDIVFTLAGLGWVVIILVRGEIYLGETIGFIGLYGVYVLVVVLSRVIYTRRYVEPDATHSEPDQLDIIELTVRSRSQSQISHVLNAFRDDRDSLTLNQEPRSRSQSRISNAINTLKRHDEEPRSRKNSQLNSIIHAAIHMDRQESQEEIICNMEPIDESSVPGSPTDINDSTLPTAEIPPHLQNPSSYQPPLRSTHMIKDALHWAQYVTCAAFLGRRVNQSMKRAAAGRRRSMADIIDYVKASRSVDKGLDEMGEEEEAPNWRAIDVTLKLWSGLYPLENVNFKNLSIVAKVVEIIKIPAMVLFAATCPVVVLGEKTWNRPLAALNMLLIFFSITALLSGYAFKVDVGGVPLGVIALAVGIPLAIVTYILTEDNTPPKYHWVFAYAGFVVSVLWVYCIATEIVNLLKMFGLVTKISLSILGITLLAWGNSIGDLVANIVMARQGFSRMSVAACFGAPIMSYNIQLKGYGITFTTDSLLGLGVPYLIVCIKNCKLRGSCTANMRVSQEVILGGQELILTIFYVISLFANFVIVPLRNYRIDRPYAIFLFGVYAIFIVAVVLTEFGVINLRILT